MSQDFPLPALALNLLSWVSYKPEAVQLKVSNYVDDHVLDILVTTLFLGAEVPDLKGFPR